MPLQSNYSELIYLFSMDSFLTAMKKLYQQEFLTIRDSFKRTKRLGKILIIIQELQFLSLLTLNSNLPFNTIERISEIVSYSSYYTIFCLRDSLEAIIVTKFILTLAFYVFLIAIIYLSFLMQTRKKQEISTKIKPLELDEDHQLFETLKNKKKLHQYIFKGLSIYIQFSEHAINQLLYSLDLIIIFQTFQQNSDSTLIFIGFVESIISLPIIVAYIFCQAQHQFEYRFRAPDFLGCNRQQQKNIILRYIMLTLSVVLNQFAIKNAALIIGIIYYVQQIIVSSIKPSFRLKEATYFTQVMQLQGVVYLIMVILEMSLKNQKIIILYLFINPLLIVLQKKYIFYDQNKVLNIENFFQDEIQFENVIRGIFVLQSCIYNSLDPALRNQNFSIQLFTFTTQHTFGCEDVTCFCKQKNNYQTIINKLIQQNFDKYLQNHQNSSIEIWLSYTYFLTHVVKQPIKAYTAALLLSQRQSNLSQKIQMIITDIRRTAYKYLCQMLYKSGLKNQRCDFRCVFNYAISIQIVKSNLAQLIYMYKNWYYNLINNKKNSQFISKSGKQLFQATQILQNQLNELFKANPSSSEIETLYTIFYTHLNFNQKREKQYRKNSKITDHFLKSFQREAFQKDSFLIHINLLEPLGMILNSTSNFPSNFGYLSCENRNSINVFLPDIIAKSHNMYLNNFVEHGRIHVLTDIHRFLMFKNSESFIEPIQARFKVESFSQSQFGVTALMSKFITDDHFIMVSESGTLEELCSHLYHQFQKSLKLKLEDVKGLDFLVMMPQLWSLIHGMNNQEMKQYQFTLIIPTAQQQIEYLKQQKTNQKLMDIDRHKRFILEFYDQLIDAALFDVKFELLTYSAINQNVFLLRIFRIKQVKKMSLIHKFSLIKGIVLHEFPDAYKYNARYDASNLDPNYLLEEQNMTSLMKKNFKAINPKVDYLPVKQLTIFKPRASLIDMPSLIEQIDKRIKNKNENLQASQSVEFNDSDRKAIDDNNSIMSTANQTDQLSKIMLIKLVLYSNYKLKSQKTLRMVFIAALVLHITLSSIYFYFIQHNLASTIENIQHTHQILYISIALNDYVIFREDKIMKNSIQDFYSKQLKDFIQMQNEHNLYVNLEISQFNHPVDIFFSLSYLMEYMQNSEYEIIFQEYFQITEGLKQCYYILLQLYSESQYDEIGIINLFISGMVFTFTVSIAVIVIYIAAMNNSQVIQTILNKINVQKMQYQQYNRVPIYSKFNCLQETSHREEFLSKEAEEDQFEIPILSRQTSSHDKLTTSRISSNESISPIYRMNFQLLLQFIGFLGLMQLSFLVGYFMWKSQSSSMDVWIETIDQAIKLEYSISQINYQFKQNQMVIQTKSNEEINQYLLSFSEINQFNLLNSNWQQYMNQISEQFSLIKQVTTIDYCQFFDLQNQFQEDNYLYVKLDNNSCTLLQRQGIVIALTEIIQYYDFVKEQMLNIQLISNQELEYPLISKGVHIQAGLSIFYNYLQSHYVSSLVSSQIQSQVISFIINIFISIISFYLIHEFMDNKIGTEFNDNKHLLTLIPGYILIENSYAIGFIQREYKQIRM